MTSFTDRWQSRLDAARERHHVPGASLAVLADGTLTELASGVLHGATGFGVTPDSVFLAGSLAKAYTATLTMQLVDDGLLGLDDPIVEVLPEFATPDPDQTAAITVRQLLSHTAGVTKTSTSTPAGGTTACRSTWRPPAPFRWTFRPEPRSPTAASGTWCSVVRSRYSPDRPGTRRCAPGCSSRWG